VSAPPRLPSWAALSLAKQIALDALTAAVSARGIAATLTRDGLLQLPGGFLAWLDDEAIPARLVDKTAAQRPVPLGPATLHVSGGGGMLDMQLHQQQTTTVRRMTADLRRSAALAGTPPGEEPPRVISAAARKVEHLTAILRALAPLARAVVFPCANGVAFSAEEFAATSAEYAGADDSLHFPLYVFCKLRDESDAPYLTTMGLFVFALPEVALPLPAGASFQDVMGALGELQREMVLEGWWPEHGATFESSLGPLRLESVEAQGDDGPVERIGVFAVPPGPFEPAALAQARYRFAFERCAAAPGILGTMDRLHQNPPSGFVVDHHLRAGRDSFAVTNGLGLRRQEGATVDDENERVELLLPVRAIEPWALNVLWVAASQLHGHDASRPMHPFDRIVFGADSGLLAGLRRVLFGAPLGGIVGAILWPRRDLKPRVHATPVSTWALAPILADELAAFRARPGAQQAWIEERTARGDVEEIFARWEHRS
jgi:hypothetical protein